MWKDATLQMKNDIIHWDLSAYFTNRLVKGIFFTETMLEKYIYFEKKCWNFF